MGINRNLWGRKIREPGLTIDHMLSTSSYAASDDTAAIDIAQYFGDLLAEAYSISSGRVTNRTASDVAIFSPIIHNFARTLQKLGLTVNFSVLEPGRSYADLGVVNQLALIFSELGNVAGLERELKDIWPQEFSINLIVPRFRLGYVVLRVLDIKRRDL